MTSFAYWIDCCFTITRSHFYRLAIVFPIYQSSLNHRSKFDSAIVLFHSADGRIFSIQNHIRLTDWKFIWNLIFCCFALMTRRRHPSTLIGCWHHLEALTSHLAEFSNGGSIWQRRLHLQWHLFLSVCVYTCRCVCVCNGTVGVFLVVSSAFCVSPCVSLTFNSTLLPHCRSNHSFFS